MREATVRMLCIAIILWWLLGIVAYGLTVLAGLGMNSHSPFLIVAIPVFAIFSLVFMVYGAFLEVHFTVVTIAVGATSLVIALVKRSQHQWSWTTVVLAFAALIGHLCFLLYPLGSGGWLDRIGLWPLSMVLYPFVIGA